MEFFRTVQIPISIFAFSTYKKFNAAKRENLDYEAACADWERIYGDKVADSMSKRQAQAKRADSKSSLGN